MVLTADHGIPPPLSIIPLAAIAPILIFIGVVTANQHLTDPENPAAEGMPQNVFREEVGAAGTAATGTTCTKWLLAGPDIWAFPPTPSS